jgi:hypothetical protein
LYTKKDIHDLAQLIPPFLASAFERMGSGNKSLEQVAINTGQTAASVSVGGDLYQKMDELVNALKSGGSSGGGKVSIKEAIVLRLTAGSLKPIGLGLGIIIDALERAPEGKELKLKMEALTNGLLSLANVGYSILKFAATMILATPLLLIAGVAALIWVPMLKLMITGLLWATDKLDKKALKKVLVLGDVGKALLILSASLVLMSLLAPQILKGMLVAGAVLLGFGLLGMLLDKMKIGKSMGRMAKMLSKLSVALLGLSVGLILMGLLTQPILVGLATASLVVLTLAGMFWLIDKMQIDKAMRKTSKALMLAAGAILAVSVSLVLSSLIVSTLGWAEVGKVLLLVGAVALTFWIIDKTLGKSMKKGALGLIFAAGAILAIAIAIFFARLLIGPVNTENVIETFGVLAVVGAVAIVFGLAGLAAKQIKKGSIAMMFAGGALIVVALGVYAMKKALEGVSWGNLGMMAAVIVGVGLAFGIAGAGPIPLAIALGSAAMIVAGIALITIGFGVGKLAEALKDVTWEKVGIMGAVIGGIGVAMGLAGLGAPLIIIGAAAMAIAGVALIAVSSGLEILQKINFNKFGTIDKKGTGAFAWSGQVTTGIIATLFGSRRKSNLEVAIESIVTAMSLGPLQIISVLAGAPVVLLAGKAMQAVALGLMEVQKLTSKIDLKTLTRNVSGMVYVLADTFGAIGAKYPGGRASIFSGGSLVAQGVSSTMGMGSALSGIARGMQAMANLKFPTKYDKDGNPIEFESMDSDAPIKVAVNAAMITGVLADVFGKIGKKYPGGKKSLFAQIMTGSGNSPVADGISSVQGMGGALTGIAKGFQSMANLNFPVEWDKEGNPIKFETIDIETNLPKVLMNTWMIVQGLSTVFGELGKNPNAQTKWWGGRSTIQKGIDLVTGVGTPLVNLAKGVQNMANLKFPTGFDKDGKATGYETLGSPTDIMTKVTGNTKLLIRALVEVFTEIGQMEGTSDGYYWWSSSSFDKGKAIISGIAEPYKKLGEALKEVMGSVGKMDTTTFAGKMTDILRVFVGAGEINASTKDLDTKRWYIEAMGNSFEKMKTAIPAIVNGANSFNEKKGGAFFSALVGPTDKGSMVDGYNAQKLLWKAIGTNTQTMSTAMPGISQAINSMDLEKLVEARTMFEALGVLAKGGSAEDILSKMGESLEEAMERLATILNDFKQTVEDGNNTPTVPTGGGGATTGASGGGSPAPKIQFPSKMVVSLDRKSIDAIKEDGLGGGR